MAVQFRKKFPTSVKFCEDLSHSSGIVVGVQMDKKKSTLNKCWAGI